MVRQGEPTLVALEKRRHQQEIARIMQAHSNELERLRRDYDHQIAVLRDEVLQLTHEIRLISYGR